MWLVVTEWDGEKPPTTYYNRLHRLGLYVRGDKTESPIKRRTRNTDASVIVQESTVLCGSESLAREISYLAQKLGARDCRIGEIDLGEFTATDEDTKVLAHIDSILGKRGRPSKEAVVVDRVITCMEEGDSFNIAVEQVLSCPSCHGFKILSRPGHRDRVSVPLNLNTAQDLFNAFLGTYFAHGYFEVPIFDPNASMPNTVAISDMNDPKDQEVAHLIQSSAFVDLVAKSSLGDYAKIKYLRSIFLARKVKTLDYRRTARIRAITNVLERGNDPRKVSLAESTYEVDTFDAATYENLSYVTTVFEAVVAHANQP